MKSPTAPSRITRQHLKSMHRCAFAALLSVQVYPQIPQSDQNVEPCVSEPNPLCVIVIEQNSGIEFDVVSSLD